MKIKNQMVVLMIVVFLFTGLISAENNGTDDRYFKISAGYGVPYGYTGVNFEVNPLLPQKLNYLNNYLSFSLGIGYKAGRPLLSLGINGYPLGRKGFFQPRISFYYAKIDRILDIYNTYEEDYDSVEALCIGSGVVLQVLEGLSINADAFYLAHLYDDLYLNTNHSRFKFSIGAQLKVKSPYEVQASGSSFLNVGTGVGIPYGVIGVNIEMNPLLPGAIGKALHDYFSVSIGAGFTNAGGSYSIGFRFYPLGKNKAYRLRLGVYQGTVAVYMGSNYAVNMEGFALSGGLLYKLSKHLAFDCDFVYVAKIFGWSSSNISRYKVSFGMRFLTGD
jgi:hypothetical protein